MLKVMFEFSGLCVVNLEAPDDATGVAASGAAHLAPYEKHQPLMYIPTSSIQNADMLGDPKYQAFGWRTITVPGGQYLTAIDLTGTHVTHRLASRTISYECSPGAKDRARGLQMPARESDWRSLAYSLDASEFFGEPDWGKAQAHVDLPPGALSGLQPQEMVERNARWKIKYIDADGKPSSFTQALTDRLGLLVETTDDTMVLTLSRIVDGAPVTANVIVKGASGEAGASIVTIGVSSHCCLTAGQLFETLDGYASLFDDRPATIPAIEDAGGAECVQRPICPAVYYRT